MKHHRLYQHEWNEKYTHVSFSINFWSILLKKKKESMFDSCKNLAMSVAILTESVTSLLCLAGVASKDIMSLANPLPVKNRPT